MDLEMEECWENHRSTARWPEGNRQKLLCQNGVSMPTSMMGRSLGYNGFHGYDITIIYIMLYYIHNIYIADIYIYTYIIILYIWYHQLGITFYPPQNYGITTIISMKPAKYIT